MRPVQLPPPGRPMEVARLLAAAHFEDSETGHATLRQWQGGWWEWVGSRWVEREPASVRKLAYGVTEHATYAKGDKDEPWAPTKRKIGDLLEALAAVAHLDADVQAPAWLDGAGPEGPIVACANGLLDVPSRELLPHAPSFFNVVSVPFGYDAAAARPAGWLTFLAELWPDQPDSIAALQEFF
jgi:putative DNA primase/helicase